MIIKFENPIRLCSRCTANEISSWAFDNQLKLEREVLAQIREELKDIKLKPGECIACSRPNISDSCFERVLSVLEKNKQDKEIILEFKSLFGLSLKLAYKFTE